MRKIFLLSISTVFILSSCCKDREDRTNYLSSLQKETINMYERGDTFLMLKDEVDTILFSVTEKFFFEEVEGAFCRKQWTEKGRIEINGFDKNNIQKTIYIWASGGFDNVKFFGDLVNIQKELKPFIGCESCYSAIEENDSIFFSTSEGVIKVSNLFNSYKIIEK
jgi:hypothetical protein